MCDKLLKPCPFCGGKPEIITSSDGFTSIGCRNCNPLFGVMLQKDSREKAVRVWNHRRVSGCENLSKDGTTVDCDHDRFFAVSNDSQNVPSDIVDEQNKQRKKTQSLDRKKLEDVIFEMSLFLEDRQEPEVLDWLNTLTSMDLYLDD